jgi:phage terminase large subunit-like protein
METDAPDARKLLGLARQTLSSAERRAKYRRIDFLDKNFWYETQLKFFAAGSSGAHQRLIYGGNQTGKTVAAGAEFSWHMTGDYPDWWVGKRFRKPIRAWIVGESLGLMRDAQQEKLCGGIGRFGEGLIPLEALAARKPIMVPGGQQVIDTMFVTHQTDGKVDGVSSASLKSFDQRREKLQSETVDLIWVDERPPADTYSELYARTIASDGHVLVSYTPIGDGAAAGITYTFLSEPSADRSVHRIDSSEVKHVTTARHEEVAGAIPEHERETRLEGVPQLGSGPVFPLEFLPAIVRHFNPEVEIRPSARWCVGVDFGYAHNFAAVMIAWHPDTGELYVVNSFTMARSSAIHQVQRIHDMTGGLRLAIAWPHDGSVHDKGSGIALKDQFKIHGANMMPHWARNHGTTHYNILPALEDMRAFWYSEKMVIAPYNKELIDELRHYHTDENFRIVKQRDDLVSALRYAVMMRRFGKPREECDGLPYGPTRFAGYQHDRGGDRQVARGTPYHPDGDMDVFR